MHVLLHACICSWTSTMSNCVGQLGRRGLSRFSALYRHPPAWLPEDKRRFLLSSNVDVFSPGSKFTQHNRALSLSAVNYSPGEDNIKRILQEKFPQSTEIEVNDVSGGCGSMYQIYIEAEEFRGKKLVDQQRMVNAVLENEIAAMHGLSLQTAVPKK